MDNEVASAMIQEQIDCVCVIHGDKYDWIYVDHLYKMVRRNFSYDVRFHVFTEESRSVPEHMIKHVLTEWPGINGPRKSWWYKMQLFNPTHFASQILYLDLDIAIADNLDWICGLDTDYFWTIRDWRYLWRPKCQGINSSVMYWDNKKFNSVWQEFCSRNIDEVIQQYRGDQDFIDFAMPEEQKRFFPEEFVKSWRWQIKDGGLDFKTRNYRRPNAGAIVDPETKIIVFHGNPKPHEIVDPIIRSYWAQ